MRVSYSEGVAIHTAPESCAVPREGQGEALTGDRAGWVLSRESLVRGADAVETAEGHMEGSVKASALSTPRGLRPQHVRTLLAREPGDLRAGHQRLSGGPHREGPEGRSR